MLEERVKCKELLDKVMEPIEVAEKIIPRKGTIACSGMGQMGTPKVVPPALARYAQETGEKFELNLITVGSAAPELDGELAKINAIRRRYNYQNNPVIRAKIHEGITQYYDTHLSEFPEILRCGFLEPMCGKVDVALLEVTAVKEDGSLIPVFSVDILPTLVRLAEKIVLEVAYTKPLDIEGIHDIFDPGVPPNRRVIPITKVDDRVGTTYVPCDPKKVVAVVESEAKEKEVFYGRPTAIEEKIAENLIDFLNQEVSEGRLPKNLLPLQTGIGPVGEAIVSALAKSDFENLSVWTEVLQVNWIDLIDTGQLRCASSSVLYMPPHEEARNKRLVDNIDDYKKHIVLRPIEVSNSHEMIRRMGVIAMNQAVEVDIYGFVNSSHVLGGKVVNGIGGSVEFARDAYLSIFLLSSTTKGGKISRIVPMVTHVDTVDHDVDVVITEQGWADLRGKSPVERAKEIIDKCAHPDYKDALFDYLERAVKKVRGHMPHLLDEAFSWHLRYMETGSMK